MRVALLIIFSYIDSLEDEFRWRLPGVEVDLYQYYKFAKKMNADKILVITDISDDYKVSDMSHTISKGIVDVSILKIISKIKKENNYWYYTHKADMESKIWDQISDATELFIYYTGHGSKNRIVLPNINKLFSYDGESAENDGESAENDEIMFYDADLFMIDILTRIKNRAEILMIMDCCQITGMKLPFKMKDGMYYTNKDCDYTQHNIICFTSSLYDENSITVTHGSVFSRSLYKILNNYDIYNYKYRSIGHILNALKRDSIKINNYVSALNVETEYINCPTSNVYSSYPDLKMLWTWVFGHNDNFKIEIDQFTSSIRLTVL